MNVFCAGLGTSGTMTGVGMYLKQERPEVFRVGANNPPCEMVPGTRSVALMEPIKFPWQEVVDKIEECLLGVDRYHNDKSWEIKTTVLLPSLYPELLNYPSVSCWKEVLGGSILSVKDNQIWDLGTVVDFDWHLPGAVTKPLMNLTAETPSPFFDTKVMEILWWKMETIANDYVELKGPEHRTDHILLVCYNGDTFRMATSALRARGIKAINLVSGMNNLAKEIKKTQSY